MLRGRGAMGRLHYAQQEHALCCHACHACGGFGGEATTTCALGLTIVYAALSCVWLLADPQQRYTSVLAVGVVRPPVDDGMYRTPSAVRMVSGLGLVIRQGAIWEGWSGVSQLVVSGDQPHACPLSPPPPLPP